MDSTMDFIIIFHHHSRKYMFFVETTEEANLGDGFKYDCFDFHP